MGREPAKSGYQWSTTAWRPWLRAGFFRGSGDATPADAIHGTFFPVMPTVRKYSLSTVYSLMNLSDVFVQTLFVPSPTLSVRVDLHRLDLVTAADRWYAGSGATQKAGTNFGYAGRRSNGATSLGTMLEGSADRAISRRWSVNGYVGVMKGGDVVRGTFAGELADIRVRGERCATLTVALPENRHRRDVCRRGERYDRRHTVSSASTGLEVIAALSGGVHERLDSSAAGCLRSSAATLVRRRLRFATDRRAPRPGVIPFSIAPTRMLASSPDLLALGKKTFEKECVACHGAAGNGEGDASYLLYPRPRDFTSGQFRIISTWDGVPTDDDLFRTISRGMPGSAMPSWAHLPEETRWGLVHYVKSFAKRPLTINAAHEPDTFGSGGAGLADGPAGAALRRSGAGARARSCSRRDARPATEPPRRATGAEADGLEGFPDAAPRSDARRLQGQPRARIRSTAGSSPACRDRRCRRAGICRATTAGISRTSCDRSRAMRSAQRSR